MTTHSLRPSVLVHRPSRFARRTVALDDATPKRILFVASTGGHLAQLFRLSSTMNATDSSAWLTFDSEQSQSLLVGRKTYFVPYVAPRDVVGVWKTFVSASKLLKREHFDEIVSTGAAVAMGAFLAARLRRVRAVYIESVSRVAGPSLTGRLLAAFRLAELNTQHAGWAHGRWALHASVLSAFTPVPRVAPQLESEPLRTFVTLGTIRPYRFDSLIDALLATGEMNENTVWQVGVTTRTDLPGTVVAQMTGPEFENQLRTADVVVSHAGVGTILQMLEMGVHPVVVPRRKARGEHVDDHQMQITQLVNVLGVATTASVEELTAAKLRAASLLATA